MTAPSIALDRLRVGTLWRFQDGVHKVTEMALRETGPTRRGPFDERGSIEVDLEFESVAAPTDSTALIDLAGRDRQVRLDGECWWVHGWTVDWPGARLRVSLTRNLAGDEVLTATARDLLTNLAEDDE